MANLMKVTNEYTNCHGQNKENAETVFEVRMSKANAAKFAKRIEAVANCEDDLYAAHELVDENTVSFATGYTNENDQVESLMIEDIIITIGWDFRFTN